METSWFIALYRVIIYVGFVASSFSLCENDHKCHSSQPTADWGWWTHW